MLRRFIAVIEIHKQEFGGMADVNYDYLFKDVANIQFEVRDKVYPMYSNHQSMPGVSQQPIVRQQVYSQGNSENYSDYARHFEVNKEPTG